jgi:hypothetical protein
MDHGDNHRMRVPMPERSKALGMLVAGLLVASCGRQPALQGTCGKGTLLDAAHVLCFEARANNADELRSIRDVTCGEAHWSNGGSCPRDDRLGGCLSVFHDDSDGTTLQQIYWYYPDATVRTEADAMSQCRAGVDTFVPADGGFPPL